jgi:hypothetical protein
MCALGFVKILRDLRHLGVSVEISVFRPKILRFRFRSSTLKPPKFRRFGQNFIGLTEVYVVSFSVKYSETSDMSALKTIFVLFLLKLV